MLRENSTLHQLKIAISDALDHIPLQDIVFDDYWVSEDQQLWKTDFDYSSVECYCRTKPLPPPEPAKTQSTELLIMPTENSPQITGRRKLQDEENYRTKKIFPFEMFYTVNS